MKKKPNRKRIKKNLTLSPLVLELGEKLADLRGIKFSHLVEMAIRDELRKAGRLPPESK